jgi:tetratricopeptide (TPR) repeat protein
LDLTPADDHRTRAVAHNQLGDIYRQAGDAGQALRHYLQALKHEENRDDIYSAGQTRYSIAALLAGDDRASEAIKYARAALENFQQAGPGAADEAGRTRQLITGLEKQLIADLEKGT